MSADVGQHMLMLLCREHEPALRCWLCPETFQTRRGYLVHLAERHP